jgi:hypothetical protein
MNWIADPKPSDRPKAVQKVADVLPEAHRRADWRTVRALYSQLVQQDCNFMRDELMEAFAHELRELTSCSEYGKSPERLCEHALAVLAEVEGHETLDVVVYRTYYEDDRFVRRLPEDPPRARRRCAPFESIVETTRRIRDAHRLREAFRDTRTSALLVGSTGYGGFYNVRGNRHGHAASDLDVLIVIDDASALTSTADALYTLPGVSTADVDRLAQRAWVFARKLDDGRTVLSHKIALWTGGTRDPMLPAEVAPADYLLSLHMMTPATLDYILVSSTPRLLSEVAGIRRSVMDYREAATRRRDHVRTFTGRSYRLGLDIQQTQHGFLRSTRVYFIDESDHYCPGFFQTMFLPRPDALWDDLLVRPALQAFYSKLSERVRYEKEKHPHSLIRQSFAHVRREAFASRIVRTLDDAYWRT